MTIPINESMPDGGFFRGYQAGLERQRDADLLSDCHGGCGSVRTYVECVKTTSIYESLPFTVRMSVHDASTFPFMLDFFKRFAWTQYVMLLLTQMLRIH